MANLEDPLEGYSGLSLFTRTFASLPGPSHPNNPDDLLSIHNFLKSLPVQNPDKLMEQGKKILDSTLEPANTEMAKDLVSEEGKNEVVVGEKGAESPQGRRPGLGRKRARFSLLPNSSQASVNLEPSLDMDKLKDPEEFFLAFERFENAKREIAKQTGHVSTDLKQFSTSLAPRPRRTGIPGRSREVKYKHLYPTMSSHEVFEEGMLSTPNGGSQQETAYPDVASQDVELVSVVTQQTDFPDVASEEMELAGSIAKAENRVDKLLGELLAHDDEELDGDRAVSLLQDRLQIKPLEIEKLNLPELQAIPRIDLKASGGNLPKPRNVLSDIHNLLKVTRSKTPMKQKKAESSMPSFGSPTPPKSPLASLTLLKKRILQSNPSRDPFSSLDIDQSPPRNSPIENVDKESDAADTEKELSISGKLKSLIIEEDDSVAGNMSSPKVAIGDFTSLFDKSMNDHLTILDSGNDVGPSESCAEWEYNNIGKDNGIINEKLSQPAANVDVQTARPNELEDTVEDMLQDAVASVQPDLRKDDFTVETLNNSQNQPDQSNPPAVEDHEMDGCSKTHGSVPEHTQETALEQHNEKICEPTVISINERTRKKSRSRKGAKNKACSRRQSLAAAGTSWENGLRRSTRIRSRPLEYWKGERFLYGRIHGSLATVIGIKYKSPGKDNEKPTIKVRSFVSDEFKDLVELAALH